MEKNVGDTPEDIRNYMRLQNVLSSVALPSLRQLFCDAWRNKYQSEWKDSKENGSKLVTDFGRNIFKPSHNIQRKMLQSGEIEKWDLPLVINVLQAFPKEFLKVQKKKPFDTLKDIRNKLSHQGGIHVDTESFESMWKGASDALTELGISNEQIEKAKLLFLAENKSNGSIENAEKLKSEGNSLFAKKIFDQAIEKYSEAILQPGITTKNLAILFANRSAAYLKLGNVYKAKEDGKMSTLLNPNWWKSFSRLAAAYQSAENVRKLWKILKRH